MTLSVQLHLN